MKKTAILLIASALCAIATSAADVVVGAARVDEYLPALEGKRVALLSNHTGMVGDTHTLDLMLDAGVDVVTLFSPEHGFRGTADAGEHVGNSVDAKTGLPIASLYAGKGSREPSSEVMAGFDVIVSDLQDVGTRFYTYYCTMVDLMNAAAKYGKAFVVLDRPNPNGMTVDGPVLDMTLESGVGRLPIPVVHGLTLGELATMVVGEGWLKCGKPLDLTVVKCEGYTHSTRYVLPVAPSPNLKDMKAIYLYPSTCFFEATDMSVGRGTDSPFKIYGHPAMRGDGFTFTPRSMPGAKRPPLMDKLCNGVDLSDLDDDEIIAEGLTLKYIIDAYQRMGKPQRFLTPFFDKLIGNRSVRSMIYAGKSADEIKASWHDDVESFKSLRSKYLLYDL